MLRGLFALGVVLAVPATAAGDWVYASSSHFEIYTTAGETRAREALAYFERVRAFFADFLQLTPGESPRTRLVVFAGDEEYGPYRPTEQAIAYFLPGHDRDSIVMASFDAEAYPVVVHEYVHLMLGHSGDRYPLWLDEGLAEFFSTLSSADGRMSIGRVPQARLEHLNAGGPLLDLERLFTIDHASPEYTSAHAGLFYSQSWALTHMLLADEAYRDGWGRFRALVTGGLSSSEALHAVYGRGVDAVFADLQAYIRSGRYSFFSTAYDAPDDRDPPAVRAVDEFEAGLVLASLLAARGDRVDQARAAFDRLAARRPDDRALADARAHFELLRGGDAAPYLEHAVSLDSTDSLLYYEYARVLRDRDPVARRRMLERAVALAPGVLQYRLELAAGQLNGADAAGAVVTLAPVREVPADSAFMLFQLRANALAQLDRRDEALAAARLAATYARDSNESRFAAQLVAALVGETASGASTAPAGTAISLDGLDMVVVAGRLRAVVCGDATIAEVIVDDRVLPLLVDAPDLVQGRDRDAATLDLACGPKDHEVRVGYIPPVGEAGAGRLRLIELR